MHTHAFQHTCNCCQQWMAPQIKGPAEVSIPISVVPLTSYKDAPAAWRKLNTQETWQQLANEEKHKLLVKAVTSKKRERAVSQHPPQQPSGSGVAGVGARLGMLRQPPPPGGPPPVLGAAQGDAIPPTIAVQMPAWPGQSNIMFYSTLPPSQFNGGVNDQNGFFFFVSASVLVCSCCCCCGCFCSELRVAYDTHTHTPPHAHTHTPPHAHTHTHTLANTHTRKHTHAPQQWRQSRQKRNDGLCRQ